MLKNLDKVLSASTFQWLMIIVTALTLIPFIHYAYGGYVKYILALGIIVCLWQLSKKKYFLLFKDKANIILLCFACSYLISIIVNREYCFGANVKQWIYMIVFFLLFFVEDINVDKLSLLSNLKCLSALIVLLCFVLSFLSFLVYYYNVFEWYYLDSNVMYYIGMVNDNKLWGLYNSNTCGTVAALSIILSAYLCIGSDFKKNETKIVVRIILIVNMFFQYVVLVLSQSRGALYSLLGVLVVTLFVFIIKNYKRNRTNQLIRTLIAFVLSFVVLFGLIKLSDIVYEGRKELCSVSVEEANNKELDTKLENSIEDILVKYASSSSAFTGAIGSNVAKIESAELFDSTGRTDIWKAGVKAFISAPIFGLTREGFVEPVCNIISEESDGYKDVSGIVGGGLHNIYLTVLCSAGLVGFFLFMALLIVVIIRFAKLLLIKEVINVEALVCFAITLYFLISELVESRILFTVSFFNVVFWIYFGYLNRFSLLGKERHEEES